jgi:Flp pilus assembly protein TadG
MTIDTAGTGASKLTDHGGKKAPSKAGRRLRRVHRSRATAALEFALIFPVMLLLIAGIVEFGSVFVAIEATNRIATQYALAWANCSENSIDTNGLCSQELTTYITAASISNVVPKLILANLTLTMVEFTVSSGGTVTAVYSRGYSAVNAAQLADATTRAGSAFTLFPGPAAVQYVVVVEAEYAYSLLFFATLMSPFLPNPLTFSYTAIQLKS